MKGLHGIIFSYEKHNGLGELTAGRTPSSVPFAGRYRIIDFILSSMVNAGITDVGVVLHGNYQSLLDHLGSGKDWDLSRKHGGLRLLPPFEQTRGLDGARGKMEALAGVRSYLADIRQSHVVLADSDLIINIPIQDVYQAHLSSGADITAVCTSSVDSEGDVTFFRLDKSGRVKDTLFPLRDRSGCHRSLEIYILSKELLLELVDECMSHDQVSFRGAVLQAKADSLKIQSYVWDGYAAQIRSLNEYYSRSLELLDPSIRRELFPAARPVHTKERNDASTYVDPAGTCCNCLVADGCTIEGTVENSIVFHGVSVAKGAEVKNCILMQDVTVSRDAVLHHVIADKAVEILDARTLMGHDHYPMVIAKGSKV
ncbi:MAG: glucose-1-phosphate adenylyltransferase subunit GlgD [Oscillospiraceae bacterium]|nr:glucose-1-phosphate adenylyltransferase subunit GlgD [Oscillospiraceae bacterium]